MMKKAEILASIEYCKEQKELALKAYEEYKSTQSSAITVKIMYDLHRLDLAIQSWEVSITTYENVLKG